MKQINLILLMLFSGLNLMAQNLPSNNIRVDSFSFDGNEYFHVTNQARPFCFPGDEVTTNIAYSRTAHILTINQDSYMTDGEGFTTTGYEQEIINTTTPNGSVFYNAAGEGIFPPQNAAGEVINTACVPPRVMSARIMHTTIGTEFTDYTISFVLDSNDVPVNVDFRVLNTKENRYVDILTAAYPTASFVTIREFRHNTGQLTLTLPNISDDLGAEYVFEVSTSERGERFTQTVNGPRASYGMEILEMSPTSVRYIISNPSSGPLNAVVDVTSRETTSNESRRVINTAAGAGHTTVKTWNDGRAGIYTTHFPSIRDYDGILLRANFAGVEYEARALNGPEVKVRWSNRHGTNSGGNRRMYLSWNYELIWPPGWNLDDISDLEIRMYTDDRRSGRVVNKFDRTFVLGSADARNFFGDNNKTASVAVPIDLPTDFADDTLEFTLTFSRNSNSYRVRFDDRIDHGSSANRANGTTTTGGYNFLKNTIDWAIDGDPRHMRIQGF